MGEMIGQAAPYAVAYAAPLLITALGGLLSERSGVVNIGLEGLMLVGSFAGALVMATQQAAHNEYAVGWGLAAGMAAGALFALLHAFACVTLNANQVISGTAINILAGALTVFACRNITGSGVLGIEGLSRFDVPVLSSLPVLGPLFFCGSYVTTWLVFALLGITWIVLYRSIFGLRLRACGEQPHAADAAGIPVRRIRYIAVMLSGAFAGLGGAIMLATYSCEFNGSVFGLGFLALAALIFGQWKPLGILGATLFFGFASTLANVSQIAAGFQQVPAFLLKAFPYVATLLALVVFSERSRAPRAAGEPFERGKQ